MKAFSTVRPLPSLFQASALQLSILRIAVCSGILGMSLWYSAEWFAQIPDALIKVPQGMGRILPHLSYDPGTLLVAQILLQALCVMGIFGIFSRTTMLLTGLLGAYVLGVPQIYGKINHCNHLIWFALILAAGPCGDVLSVDGLFKAIKRADRGNTEPPLPSKVYGLPLFFVLFLIGIIYFFPGYWKMLDGGWEWIWSDNLKWILYRKWAELPPDWQPFLRIDRHFLIYRSIALATVIFELTFIVFIFFPRLRAWLGAAGLLFHNATWMMMQIPFWYLQVCYVAFFDWEKIFLKTGSWMFRDPLRVIYDADCKLCRRTIAVLRSLDILGGIEYLSAYDRQGLARAGLGQLRDEDLIRDMHAVTYGKVWKGYDSYRAISKRIPVLWPALPFLYVWPVTAIGRGIYRHVADSRTCALPERDKPFIVAARLQNTGRRVQIAATIAMGSFLVIINSVFGFLDLNSWPFSVYPTFQGTQSGGTRQFLAIEPLGPNGEVLAWNEEELRRRVNASRWAVIGENALKKQSDPLEFKKHLSAIRHLMAANDPVANSARRIRFYRVSMTGEPEKRKDNPLEKELLWEWPLGAASENF